jgi:hypothetical protein
MHGRQLSTPAAPVATPAKEQVSADQVERMMIELLSENICLKAKNEWLDNLASQAVIISDRIQWLIERKVKLPGEVIEFAKRVMHDSSIPPVLPAEGA